MTNLCSEICASVCSLIKASQCEACLRGDVFEIVRFVEAACCRVIIG